MIIDLKVTKTSMGFLCFEIWRRNSDDTATPEILSITMLDWVDSFKVDDANLAILNDFLRKSLRA